MLVALSGIQMVETMSKDWLHLNDQMLLGGRQTQFLMLKNNPSKVGMNSLFNKFYVLNSQIKLSHFNLRLNCYKNATKKLFKTFER